MKDTVKSYVDIGVEVSDRIFSGDPAFGGARKNPEVAGPAGILARISGR